ncbi:Pescadillo homolog (AtPES) [Durusdinium trenchii]|uniref:Pescadillo homolog n=1 Tax=Durusdinium trenchii TaxID=1381693 RepID=A0ABP0QJP0_9DINO
MAAGKMGRKEAGTLRAKGRATVKKKSIKTKALDMNSKRRLAKLGKKQKSGHSGVVVQYITRSRALKKLQVTLRDFRRLCILKGIYPRQPKKKNLNKTCYHVKDIAFLAHEPLLRKFHDFKAYMKKVRRQLNRKNLYEANRLFDNRPQYTLEHLIRERYPRFGDSLADMDDALCLIHLFAIMHSTSTVHADRTVNCLKLTREWQLYVVMSRSLRKTFVSVKGIYYQAEVMGQSITWIVPHKFSQDIPKEVDFRVMSTFLEFYESLIGFVLFKLYHGLGMRYPPRLDQSLDQNGAHLACIQPERLVAARQEGNPADEPPLHLDGEDDDSKNEESDSDDEDGRDRESAEVDETTQQEASKRRIDTLASRMSEIIKADQGEQDQEQVDANESDDLEKAVFAEDEQIQQIEDNERQIQARTNLLKGCTLWLSREVPFEPLEFVARAFGADVLSADMGAQSDDARITHFVTDRPGTNHSKNLKCEYVQPQWVFDSVNARLLLPVKRYAPNHTLPPHLSPFVDNAAEGYTPDYAKEIMELQAAAGVDTDTVMPEKLRKDVVQKDQIGAAADDSDLEDAEAKEEAFVKGLHEELEGRSGRRTNAGANKRKRDQAATSLAEEQARAKRRANSTEPAANIESESQSSEEEEVVEQKVAEDDQAKNTKTAPKEKKALKEPKQARSASSPDGAAEPKPKKFVKAKTFKGSKAGYKFQMGHLGLGYYLDENARRKITFTAGKRMSNRAKRLAQKEEEHNMRKMMMSTKAKRLYGKMQHGIKKKRNRAKALEARKAKIQSPK